jgi:hypothetical protein
MIQHSLNQTSDVASRMVQKGRRMKVAFGYSWKLTSEDTADVRGIIESLRHQAIDLGSEGVGDVLTCEDARSVKPAIMFTAIIPGSSEGRYGLALRERSSWSWNDAVLASDFRILGHFHRAAANLGIEVVQSFGGMIFTSKKNDAGIVEVSHESAFDWSNF